jgi:1,2-phenylacetyl-CoA epoxidase PaaB subunit
MKDIGLLDFVSPKDFINFHDIVKRHVEQDSTWAVEIAQVESMTPDQIQQFMEHPIKARAVL